MVSASFAAYGLRIGFEANSAEALSRILESLPPGLQRSDRPEVDLLYSVVKGEVEPASGSRGYSFVYANDTLLGQGTEFEDIPIAIEAHLSLYLAEFAPSLVFIHAGVVGWNGKAVILPGRSGVGKSSLVAALLRAGARYYSDEFAVVDRLGRVHPYPRPLHLRNDGTTTDSPQQAIPPNRVGKMPLRVGLVLITQHQKGAAWRARPISRGEGLLALLANTVSAQRDPQRALRTLRTIVSGARILKGLRGEADATVARLVAADHLLQ
jgi:hypothetical protein